MGRVGKGPPRTARGAATRDRILGAAAELMRGGGVANTSLDAVLAASEASKSQLYHYFTDKDDLILAVIRRQTDCVLATHDAYLAGVTSIAGLRRWRNAIVDLTREQQGAGGCPLGSLVSELAESPQPRTVLGEGFGKWEAVFADRLNAIRGNKSATPDAHVADLATTLLAALQGGLLLAQAMRSTRPLELALDAAIDHVAARLAPPPERQRMKSGAANSPDRSRR